MTLYRNLLVLLVFVLTSSSALAADVKIGFFEMREVVKRSEIGKGGVDKIRQEAEKARDRQAAKVKEIQELEDEFKKKENVWSQDVKKQKDQAIVSKKMEYEKANYEEALQLKRLEQELFSPLQDKVYEIVKRLGEKGGYTMILEAQQAGLVYVVPSLNLTDQIVRELNQNQAKEPKKPEGKKQ
ncbi:MAG TPA: OmpH family outer membrane protein [Syntrophobacteria bacterium]|nr:OmpH family outer membrane protein [Syntrophobacteria bacterium]